MGNGNERDNLTQLFMAFIKECQYLSCLRPQTVEGYEATFHLFMKLMPEITATSDLNSEFVCEFFKRLQTRKRIIGKNTMVFGVKPSTIKTHWSKLNVFTSWLVRKGYLHENPFHGLKTPEPEYSDPKALSNEEVHKLYSAVTRCSANTLLLRRDTLMLSILLYCGLRRGEFISVRVNDIDLEKREITVGSETSKSKRMRVLKLHPTVVLHLADYFKARNIRGLTTSNLIVSNNGDRELSRDGLRHWVRTLRNKSGVRFHLHQFRHTFACKLVEANVNILKVQKLMGHTTAAMTMRYARSLKTEDMAQDVLSISF